MHQLVYISSATEKLSDEELKNILNTARANNSRLQLTGMLLYIDGNFIQVLEGEKDTVKHLYNTILGDSRHTGAIKLLEKTINAREFPEWTMGFKSLTMDEASQLVGHKNLNEEIFAPASFINGEHPAVHLLKSFIMNNK